MLVFFASLFLTANSFAQSMDTTDTSKSGYETKDDGMSPDTTQMKSDDQMKDDSDSDYGTDMKSDTSDAGSGSHDSSENTDYNKDDKTDDATSSDVSINDNYFIKRSLA
jgi:hypothetical protein